MTYNRTAVIEHEDGQYCVKSPNNGNWSGGCYDSKGEAEKRLDQVEYFKSKKAEDMYSYSRTAGKKKPVAEKQEEEKPKKKSKSKPEKVIEEASAIEKAVAAVQFAIDAVHDCAPNGKDYREDDDFNSKAYQKEVESHSERIHALNDIREELNDILSESSKETKTASSYRRATTSNDLYRAKNQLGDIASIVRSSKGSPANVAKALIHLKDARNAVELLADELFSMKTASYDRGNWTPAQLSNVTHYYRAENGVLVDKLASSSELKPNMWYCQEMPAGEHWLLVNRVDSNNNAIGKSVMYGVMGEPQVAELTVPENRWSIWNEKPESDVPNAIREAV